MTRIFSDMVATVWRIEVSAGQSVSEGEVLVVLESMKTEIPVLAPRSGTVLEVTVSEGGSVKEGDVIVVLD
jgi:biotin carboxyl carrier protein